MQNAVVDTHALIWYLEDSPEISKAANKILTAFDQGEIQIYIPTICLVEIIYLQEKRRISGEVMHLLKSIMNEYDTGFIFMPLTLNIVDALPQIPFSVVPDMPDRIIAATAFSLNLPLLTKDRKIKQSAVMTIW